MTDPRAVLLEFATFLRQPSLLKPGGLASGESWRVWGWLTALQVAGLFAVALPFITIWQQGLGLPAPAAFSGFPQAWLIPTVVIFAPVVEELLFRGWHNGRAAALWLLGCAIIAFSALYLVTIPGRETAALGLLGCALIAAPIGWWHMRRRGQPVARFARAFPAVFYLTAAAFALVHLTNYPQVSLLAVPLVVPQLWAALVLGFVRQRIGLIAAILTHATANASSLALAMTLN